VIYAAEATLITTAINELLEDEAKESEGDEDIPVSELLKRKEKATKEKPPAVAASTHFTRAKKGLSQNEDVAAPRKKQAKTLSN
jgi:hypothetical protein